MGDWALFHQYSRAAENGISTVTILKSIRYSENENGLVITVQTSDGIPDYRSFTLETPARIVFDLPTIRTPYLKEKTIPVDTESVKRIRYYANAKRLRIVLDTHDAYLSDFAAERIDNRLIITVGGGAAAKSDQSADKAPKQSPPAAISTKKTVAAGNTESTPTAAADTRPAARISPLPAPPEQAAMAKKLQMDVTGKRKDFTQTELPDPMRIIGDRLNSPDAELPAEHFDLRKTIYAAISANIGIKISKEESEAAEALKKRQRTFFYPTLSTQYMYTRYDSAPNIAGLPFGPTEEYEWTTSFRQPIFTGFSLINQYQISGLGLDIAKFKEKLSRQDVIFDAKFVYFNLLKAQKLVDVAKKTVEQINAQLEVAKNFYQVGMTPLNSFLQAQVELANAKQDLIIARNNLETAVSDFNTLLRRPLNAPVDLVDVSTYTPFAQSLEYCQESAAKNRLEIYVANLDIEKAEKELQLSKKDFFPTVDFQGTYFKYGENWNVDGGQYIYDPEGWSVTAVASWDFWQWGRTEYGVMERKSRLKQAQHAKDELLDQIHKQVKQAYLKNLESEINIVTVKTAIEQAEENLRINQERFKEQVSTSTDVLVAQTLVTRTMTNYYNALYDFKISRAALYRATGQEIIP